MSRITGWLLLTAALASAEPAPRIASFSPAATRILVDLGVGAEIVAATRWCELPAAQGIPTTCDAFEPDLEALRRSGANLAIVPRLANPMLEERIRSAGLRTMVLSPESAESPAEDIVRLAELTGSKAAAARLLDERRRCQRAPTGKRVLIVWDGVCAGPSSYLAWAIGAAGGTPAPTTGAWPEWDIEQAATSKPDLVLLLRTSGPPEPSLDGESLERWRQTPGLRLSPAARLGRIYQLKPGSEWLPASGLPKAAKTLAELLEK